MTANPVPLPPAADDDADEDVGTALDAMTFHAGRRQRTAPPRPRPAFRRIVVAYDGSEGAEHALAWAEDLALLHGAQALVVAAYPAPQLDADLVGAHGWWPGYAAGHARARDAARAAAEGAAARLRDAGVQARSVLAEGRPVQEVARLARERDADLVVVGSRGLGPLRQVFLGSVANGLLHQAKTNVLVARTPPRPPRILVAVDGSHASYRATAYALRHASATGASVVVQHVLDVPEDVEELPRRGLLSDVVERLRLPAAPPRIRYVLDAGAPAERIVARAEEESCGLVAVGSRGLGVMQGALLGSVSGRVVATTRASVLVVREASHAA